MSAVCTVVGCALGCMTVLKLPTENMQPLVTYFTDSVSSDNVASFVEVFRSLLICNLKYIAVYYLLSLIYYIAWFTAVLPGILAFTSAFTATFLVVNYGARGVVYSMLGIIPPVVIFLPLYMFASTVCINFAHSRHCRKERGVLTALRILPALGIIYVIMAICSLYDAVIAPALFKSLF